MKLKKNKEKVSHFSKADNIIVSLYLFSLFFGGMFFILATSGISFPLSFFGIIIYVLGCCLFYVKSQYNYVYRKILNICRIVGISMMLIAYVCPVVATKYDTDKVMYPVKRYIYTHGVKSSDCSILPKYLYNDASDYYFRTEVSVPAQDYRPYSYLAFHTSEENLKKYEEKIRQNPDYTYNKNVPLDEEEYQEILEKYPDEDKWWVNRPEKLPIHVYQRLYKDAGITDNLDNSIIYTGHDSSTWNSYSGALINYETGLLLVWK